MERPQVNIMSIPLHMPRLCNYSRKETVTVKRKNDKKERLNLFIKMIKEVKFAGFVSSEIPMNAGNKTDKRKIKSRPEIW
jgi:hypothetical protein